MGYFVAVILMLAYAAITRSAYEIHTFEINKINICHKLASDKEPVFVYFADLHGTTFGMMNYRLIDAIDKIGPDAILIGGDMIVDKGKKFIGNTREKEAAIDLLNRLCEKYPVYYGFGNHETRAKESSKLNAEFKNYLYRIKNKNLHILSNAHEYVTYKGTRFCIYGLETDKSNYSKRNPFKADVSYIEKCLGESPEHKHSIPLVISHNPDNFEACAKWGAEYVFSGHNHGGFIRLPYFGGVIASNYKLFPKYDAGVYKSSEQNSHMILTRGLGTHTIKFRLFNKPELMVITFKPKN